MLNWQITKEIDILSLFPLLLWLALIQQVTEKKMIALRRKKQKTKNIISTPVGKLNKGLIPS